MDLLAGSGFMLPTRNAAVLFQPVAGGAVLLNMQQEIYFSLNEVGALVWEMLPPVCVDLTEVCDKLQARYPDVAPDALRADVAELLDMLAAEGLVIPSDTQ